MSLDRFHPLVAGWFAQRFPAPTPVQARGWEAIAGGRHALLTAPTGSGKTLAAFLAAIDALVRGGIEGRLEDKASVVYVSPLKALSSDVRKNLAEPLAEIATLARDQGLALPEIRLGLRTGDTPASERARAWRQPPHLWITTPESLYVLLGSASGRGALASVSTVIVDEVHAVADDKRGAHLALSLERLEALAGRRLQRIGVSATVSPIDEVARLLVGAGNVAADGTPDCAVIDEGSRRPIDLDLDLPDTELGPIATHELWREVLDRIAALTQGNRTTLVFVNTRRLVERVSHQLSLRLGEDAVVAHHGSLSRKTRLLAEDRLKRGEARVCVATASLELGIDIGAVDLVVHLGSPRSVAVALQRVGRSGHGVGRVPKGRLFPLTRDELVECAALVGLARRGELDRLSVPAWPLDVLAQQVVAAAAASAEPLAEDALFALVTRAWPYRELPRPRFDQLIESLAEGFAPGRGRERSLIHRDGVNREVKARRGARIAALTSGGAIPDNADYDVVLEPAGTLVGRINEDFAIESLAGDVFLLGNSSWRIRRVERGRVRVEDAKGEAPTIPFWLGEAPARTPELSRAVGELREQVDRRLERPEAAVAYLERDLALPRAAAEQIAAYVAEGKRVLGIVPTGERIVAERFFDETGGMQLVIHAPFGGRINRAWGLALRKRFCRSFDFELQASAGDDGINLSLGPQHSFPLADVFAFVPSRLAREVLTQAVLPSPIFATRWRWAVTRSLALLRHERGKKVPAAIQRMRADDLIARVFPAQVACQDNAPGGDIEIPDHPLVFEALRDALEEALDVEGLTALLARVEQGGIELHARDTTQPSVFAHQILNAMPYAFLDGAPLEERRARAVALRRALPEDARDLGRLDPEAIRAAVEDAWPRARDADELHEALLSLVYVRAGELESRFGPGASGLLAELRARGRVVEREGIVAATERAALAAAARGGREDGVLALVRGWCESSGPLRAKDLAQTLDLAPGAIAIALGALEAEGAVLRGSFTGAALADETEWCDRRILARIHRATLSRLRREIEPVETAVFLRFLAGWHRLSGGGQDDGAGALLQAIELLQGYETAAVAWEEALLPARVRGYRGEWLERLCLDGTLVWGRFSGRFAREEGGAPPAPLGRRAAVTLALRADLPWLIDRASCEPAALGDGARAVLAALEQRGAGFFADLVARTSLSARAVEEALAELVATGHASADGVAPLRRLAAGGGGRRPRGGAGEGRWWLIDRGAPAPAGALPAKALQLVRRYGVLGRELVTREAGAPPWRELLPALRRAEARGELRGGRFLAGLVGEQFALDEAVSGLRAARREAEAPEDLVVISACDPLNLAGILVPGPRVAAVPSNRLVLKDGVPVAWQDAGETTLAPGLDAAIGERAMGRLG